MRHSSWQAYLICLAALLFTMPSAVARTSPVFQEEPATASQDEAIQNLVKKSERLQQEAEELKLQEQELQRAKVELENELAAMKKVMKELATQKSAKAEAEKRRKEDAERDQIALKKLAELESAFEKDAEKFRKASRSVRTRAEYERVRKQDPAPKFAKDMFQLSEDFADTSAARKALFNAVTKGRGRSKTNAMKRMLETVEMDTTTPEAREMLELLTTYGTGIPRNKAMSHLLEFVKNELPSEDAISQLEKMISIRGESEMKTQATQLLFDSANSDPRSNKSADRFLMIAQRTNGPLKAKAMDQLLAHHIDNAKIIPLLQPIPRGTPSAQTENWLKELCAKSSGAIKAHSIITLSKYVTRRNTYRDRVADDPEQAAKAIGQETVDYLTSELDPDESTMIEEWLEQYVNDNETLLELAKKELFVMQNLSIGCTAPEITATDLDGKEFKLSDYRGKVVFLDFWGDW